jgi:hypothetical protein
MGVDGIIHIKLTILVNHQGNLGWKHIKPTKNYNHKYNNYVINFFATYEHHILDYFCLF